MAVKWYLWYLTSRFKSTSAFITIFRMTLYQKVLLKRSIEHIFLECNENTKAPRYLSVVKEIRRWIPSTNGQ